MNTVDKKFKKKIGSREEVFNGVAEKTGGGMYKSDIICILQNGRPKYISKKLSVIAKKRDNPYFKKKKEPTKKTIPSKLTSNSVKPTIKTKKIKFDISKNKIKSVYYPSLNGLNISELRNQNDMEDDEDNDDFKIEQVPDSIDFDLINLM
tara:strand:+ start:647 stop:1096 length:450 start_codon:yes stop_codon:yes gene_type:complete